MNKTSNGKASQGAPTPTLEIPDVPKVVEWLNRDLSVAISCLSAIQSDPDLLNSLAVFMQGRLINSQLDKTTKPVD